MINIDINININHILLSIFNKLFVSIFINNFNKCVEKKHIKYKKLDINSTRITICQ